MNCYRRFFVDEIVESASKTVFAHKDSSTQPETLLDHSLYTIMVFERIKQDLKVDYIIENLLSDLYDALFKNIKNEIFPKDKFIKFMVDSICLIITLHDVGKLNPIYQKKKMNNPIDINPLNVLEENFFIDSKHSKYSKILLDQILAIRLQQTSIYHDCKNDYIDSGEQRRVIFRLSFVGVVLNSIVDRHHSKLVDINLDDIEENNFDQIKYLFKDNDLKNIGIFFYPQQTKEIKKSLEGDYSFFFLFKLLYSLLILSDYYATNCYYEKIPPEDIKINCISEELIAKMEENFYSQKEYNRQFQIPETISRLKELDVKDIRDINTIRSKILAEASKNLKKSLDEGEHRIFFLNVPTGGGKTNVSMKLLLDILKHKKSENIRRGYYVFPYVNIIEQNHRVIGETFFTTGEERDNFISKIYSYNEWDFSKEEEDEEKDYYINQQFLNYPLNVISNVNFFNTFIKNHKKSNYKMANFVNSVIVLDEVQTLPNEEWEYFSKLMKEAAAKYNMYFILMSATLPDLSRFVKDKYIFKNLIDNPAMYQTHECFQRTKPVFYISGKRTIGVDFFREKIQCEQESFGERKIKILIVVNTVQNSYNLYKDIKESPLADEYDLLLLNSTILPPRKREIINKLGQNIEELEKGIILVSTQSVEAGVDIDCHLGFREYSPLDSIEQISGRVNREGNRPKKCSKIFVFDMGTYNKVYKNDIRIKIQEVHRGELENMLTSKDFKRFYDYVIQYLSDKEKDFASIFNKFLEPTYNLQFKKLAEYDYINSENIDFFVPVSFNLRQYPLSNGEKSYLQKKGLDLTRELNGNKVWESYTHAHRQKNSTTRLLDIKKLQSIVNRFSFSVYNRHIEGISLKSILKEYTDWNGFEECGGLINVDDEMLKKLDYKIDDGLNPENLEKVFGGFQSFYMI